MKAVLALALACLAISATIAEEITVKTNKGAVKGVRIDHDFGQYYYSFRGIRYAQAPVGKLRFKPPVEVEPFTEEYDATDDGNVCPQYDIGSASTAGDEDCLNLNVYAPKVDNKKRAVMVYIHGGAFIMGGGLLLFRPQLPFGKRRSLGHLQLSVGRLWLLGHGRQGGHW